MLTPQPESLVRETAPPATAVAMPQTAEAEEVAMKYLSARVPKRLRDELQHQAIREDRPVAQLVQDAVRLYLDQNTPS